MNIQRKMKMSKWVLGLLGTQILLGGSAGAAAYVAPVAGEALRAGDTVTVVDTNPAETDYTVMTSTTGVQLGTGAVQIKLTTQGADRTGILVNNTNSNLGKGSTISIDSSKLGQASAYGIRVEGTGHSLTADQLSIDVKTKGDNVNHFGFVYGIRAMDGNNVDLGSNSSVKIVSEGTAQAGGIYVNGNSTLKADHLNVDVTGSQQDTSYNGVIGTVGIQAYSWDHLAGEQAVDLGSGSKITVKSKQSALPYTGAKGVYLGGNGMSHFKADHLEIDVASEDPTGSAMGIYSVGHFDGPSRSVDLGEGSKIQITNSGDGYGYGVLSYNTDLSASDLAINMDGKHASGLHLNYDSKANLENAQIHQNGSGADDSKGIFLGERSSLKATDLTIDGGFASGIIAEGGSSIDIDNAKIVAQKVGVYAASSDVTLKNIAIDVSPGALDQTGGDVFAGIRASGGKIAVSDSAIHLTPGADGSHTVYGMNLSGVNGAEINNVSIVSEAQGNSQGILMDGYSSANLKKVSMDVQGDGLTAINSSTVNAEDLVIQAKGAGITASGGDYYDAWGDSFYGSQVNLAGNVDIKVVDASDASKDGVAILAKLDSKVTGNGKMNIQGDLVAQKDIGTGENYDWVYDEVNDTYDTIITNVVSEKSSTIDLTMTNGSVLTGSANALDRLAEDARGTVNLDMTGSQWNMTQSSNVGKFSLQNSQVNFSNAGEYETLNIADLSGSGTFKMRTDMGAGEAGATIGSGAIGTGGGDLISVSGTTNGSHLLDIQNQGSAPSNAGYEHLVVQTANGGGQFDLSHKVEVGAYQYGLHQDSGNGNNWSLYRTEELTSTAAIAAHDPKASYYLNYGEMQTLIQRMGDLRNNTDADGNVWAKVVFGENQVDKNGISPGFDQSYGGLQVGIDKKTDWKNGQFYKGVFVGYSQGSQDYHELGDSNIKAKSVGGYATYIGNNGFYVDGVLKFNWQNQRFSAVDTAGDTVTGKSSTTGASVSLETGRRISFDSKAKKGFYIEPQAQIIWGSQSGDTFTASNGLHVNESGYHSLIGRVGMLAGYEVKGGKNPINVYAKASYNHEFSGDYGATMNGAQVNGSMGDSWWTYGVGVTAQVNKKHNLYIDLERASGGDFTQDWKINAGYRFQW